MSEILRTDEELLKCAPPVDRSMFPEARDNFIAQDYGKDKHIENKTSKYIFLSDK